MSDSNNSNSRFSEESIAPAFVAQGPAASLGSGEVIKEEDTVSRTWTCMRDCTESLKVESEAKNALSDFVRQRMAAHPDMKVVRYGYQEAHVKWTKFGEPLRSDIEMPIPASARANIPCFIEFAR